MAPAIAVRVKRWRELTMSGRFRKALSKVPATNPSCTDSVNQLAAPALRFHSLVSAGTTGRRARALAVALVVWIFAVVLFEDQGEEGSRKVAILFDTQYHCAVLDVDKLAKGDIAFGSNSWRGDCFEESLRKAIRISSATTNTEGA